MSLDADLPLPPEGGDRMLHPELHHPIIGTPQTYGQTLAVRHGNRHMIGIQLR